MNLCYFDTSAIVKRYHTELGTEIVDGLFELPGVGLITSLWTVLEFIAALSAKKKRKELSAHALGAAISDFSKEIEDRFTLRELESNYLWSAARLALDHGLTSADSYHLATALDCLNLTSRSDRFAFVCADDALCRAAAKQGLFVLNPVTKDAPKLLDSLSG